MTRQTYETEQDRTREMVIAFKVIDKIGCNLDQQVQYHPFDYLAVRNEKPTAKIEIKDRRKLSINKFNTYMISKKKIDKILAADPINVKSILVIKFKEKIMFVELREGYEQKMMGRIYKTRDPQDLEVCYFIPIKEFQDL